MNAGGSPTTGNGSGNGSRLPSGRSVKLSRRYLSERERLRQKYPRLVRDLLFEQYEEFALILDLETDVIHMGGWTYWLKTPNGFEPPLNFYFTYASETLMMQIVTNG